MALNDKEQRELLTAEEDTYDMEGFTYSEILMMRQLVTDRIENRFAYAQKTACEMNVRALSAVTSEIERLEVLRTKLTEETWHEGR